MKVCGDFITNSSSTAYLITNISDEVKTIIDFVKENIAVLAEFNEDYDYDYTEKQLLDDAQALLDDKNLKKYYVWKSGEQRLVGFGDEDGNVIGHVYDYALRDGGKSKSFVYEFYESCR